MPGSVEGSPSRGHVKPVDGDALDRQEQGVPSEEDYDTERVEQVYR